MFSVGPGPVFLVVLLDLRRNANLAGGFAGRLILVVRFGCVNLICLPFSIQANRAEYLFSPLMYLSGPCHRAFTAKLEEKKTANLLASK